MSILNKIRSTNRRRSTDARGRRDLARAYASAPTRATQEELIQLSSRLR